MKHRHIVVLEIRDETDEVKKTIETIVTPSRSNHKVDFIATSLFHVAKFEKILQIRYFDHNSVEKKILEIPEENLYELIEILLQMNLEILENKEKSK